MFFTLTCKQERDKVCTVEKLEIVQGKTAHISRKKEHAFAGLSCQRSDLEVSAGGLSKEEMRVREVNLASTITAEHNLASYP